jgi:tetratricopeptide (TPR) repeat protein
VERDALLSELNRHEKRVEELTNVPENIPSWDRIALCLADALLFSGKLDECINFLRRIEFNPREGEKSARDVYSRALITRAMIKLKDGNFSSAIKDLKESTTFPLNLGSAEPSRYKDCARNYYLLGITLEKDGQRKEAKMIWERAITEIEIENSEARFYQALCHRCLGKETIAGKIINEIKEYCLKHISEVAYQEAEPHYLLSLIYIFEKKKVLARQEAAAVLKISPSHYEVIVFFQKGRFGADFLQKLMRHFR